MQFTVLLHKCSCSYQLALAKIYWNETSPKLQLLYGRTSLLCNQNTYLNIIYFSSFLTVGKPIVDIDTVHTKACLWRRRKVRGNTTPRRTTKLHKVTGPECRAERGPQSVASGLHISPGLLSSQCAAGAGAGRRPCPCAPAWRGCWWTGTGAASQVPVEQHTMHSEAPYRHN